MRITNGMMISNMLNNLNGGLSRVSKYHNQLASNRRIVNLSDDPIGVMNSLGARTQIRRLEQYQRNVTNSYSWVQQTESAVAEMNELLISCKELLTDSMGTENESDKKVFATQIRQLTENLLELCNTAMGDKYVFGGYNVTQQPFTADRDANGKITAVYYNGLDLTGRQMVGGGELGSDALCVFDTVEKGVSQLSWGGRLDLQGEFDVATLNRENEDGTFSYVVRFTDKATGEKYDAFMDIPKIVEHPGDVVTVRLETEDGISFGTVSWKNADTAVTVDSGDLAKALSLDRKSIKTTSETNKTIQIGPEADPGIVWTGQLADTSQKYMMTVDGATLKFTNTNGSDIGSYTLTSENLIYDGDGVLSEIKVDLSNVGPHPGLGEIHWAPNSLTGFKFTNNPPATAEDAAALLGTAQFVTTPLGEESTQHIQIEVGYEINVDVTYTGIDLIGLGGDNIFNLLMNIADDLEAGKDNGDLTAYLTDLSKAQDRILTQVVKSGNRTTKLDTIKNRYSLDAINFEGKRSNIEDIDQAEVITKWQYAQMIYKQALASGAQIIQPTLMDFLR